MLQSHVREKDAVAVLVTVGAKQLIVTEALAVCPVSVIAAVLVFVPASAGQKNLRL